MASKRECNTEAREGRQWEKGADCPKEGAREGIYRPVSNGPVAEQSMQGERDLPHALVHVAPGSLCGRPVDDACTRGRPTSATVHPSTKVGASALGPGPNRCARTAYCGNNML